MEPELVARKIGRAAAWLDDVESRVAGEVHAFVLDADTSDLAARCEPRPGHGVPSG